MIVLITATLQEMEAALLYVEHTVSKDILSKIKEGEGVCTKICNKDVVLLLVGVGPINSAYYIGKNVYQYSKALFLHCGIAGVYNINTAISVGTVCYVREEIYLEYGRIYGNGKLEQLPYTHYDNQEKANRLVLPNIEDIFKKFSLQYQNFPHVTSLSTACVSANKERVFQVKKEYPDATIENMEGFSVGICAKKNEIDYVGIRSISNIAGEKDSWNIPESFSALGKTIQKIFG